MVEKKNIRKLFFYINFFMTPKMQIYLQRDNLFSILFVTRNATIAKFLPSLVSSMTVPESLRNDFLDRDKLFEKNLNASLALIKWATL